MCLLIALIGRLGRRGTGFVGMLNEVPVAAGNEFGPPAMQCGSKAPPDLQEENGLARLVVDVEELEMRIGVLTGDQLEGDVECAGKLCLRVCDEVRGLPRVFDAELGLSRSERARI